MERLLPDRGVEPLDDVYADLVLPTRTDRPYVYLGMVSSVDGAAVVEGRTAGLGGAADRAAFRQLRRTCDVILVGAGTVRTEGYGPPRATEAVVAQRTARGLAPRATIAVVTASGGLDPSARLFADPAYRPVVIAPAAADLRPLEHHADVVRAGEDTVDLAQALRALGDRGARWVLCEGGPTLNAALLADGLVDELFLTIAPTLVGDAPLRIVEGALPEPLAVELVELRSHAGELLLRYAIQPTRGQEGSPAAPTAPR